MTEKTIKAQINIFIHEDDFVTILSDGDELELYNMLRRFGYISTTNKNALYRAVAALAKDDELKT